MEYTFADAGFEVSGQDAVLRWARVGPNVALVLPGSVGAAASVSQEALLSLPGYANLVLRPGVVRIGIQTGADLSRAFDVKFVNGRLDRVELWIGC